jgi:hypothetical protein
MSRFSALLTFAGTLGMSESRRQCEYRLLLSRPRQAPEERQVAARNRPYMDFLYKLSLNDLSRPNPDVQKFSLKVRDVLQTDIEHLLSAFIVKLTQTVLI